MTARPLVIFPGLEYGRMLIANDELGALADRVQLELPRMVERIRLIDEPKREETVAA